VFVCACAVCCVWRLFKKNTSCVILYYCNIYVCTYRRTDHSRDLRFEQGGCSLRSAASAPAVARSKCHTQNYVLAEAEWPRRGASASASRAADGQIFELSQVQCAERCARVLVVCVVPAVSGQRCSASVARLANSIANRPINAAICSNVLSVEPRMCSTCSVLRSHISPLLAARLESRLLSDQEKASTVKRKPFSSVRGTAAVSPPVPLGPAACAGG
jgi:hypothetical protein